MTEKEVIELLGNPDDIITNLSADEAFKNDTVVKKYPSAYLLRFTLSKYSWIDVYLDGKTKRVLEVWHGRA